MSRSLLLSAALFGGFNAYADTIDASGDIDQRDIQALREWVNTKRQVTVNEKGGALSISGEVRTEMQATGETRGGEKQRGLGSRTNLPTRAYDIEVNIMMDYRTDRTWASIKLEFDNDMGIFTGSKNKIKLERAWMGGRIVDAETFTFDTELGRRVMNSIFDSKVEGDSLFDGILLRYDHGFDNVGEFFIHSGALIVNDRHDHYAYATEIGMLNIANTGLYTKYLWIDWDTKDYKNESLNEIFDFMPNQFQLGYRFLPKKLGKVITTYAAALYNPLAKQRKITNHKRSNWGGYFGFIIGELRKAHDWSFEAYYQVMQAQVVPDFDSAGIGLGNAVSTGLYNTMLNGTGTRVTSRHDAAGNGNFRGYSLNLDYLLTNNFTLQQKWNQAITLDTDIGPFRRYKSYELELIYGF
jgi:hypothetical protein